MNPELMTKLIESIVTVVIVIITAYVIPWLKNKIGEDKFNQIMLYAEMLVRSAEKIYTVEEWKEKKQYTVAMLTAKANEMGVELTDAEINAIIEGAVKAIKG